MKGASRYIWIFLAFVLGIFCLFAAAFLTEENKKDNFSLERTNCKSELQAEDTCQIYVRFHPKQDGDLAGLITIRTSGGEQKIYVSGSAPMASDVSPTNKTGIQVQQDSLQLYTLKNRSFQKISIYGTPVVSNQTRGGHLIPVALVLGASLLVFSATSLFYLRREER